MNLRQRVDAVLHYRPYDSMPVVHFGFWPELLQKWAAEGHIRPELIESWADASPADREIAGKLGFDMNWNTVFVTHDFLFPRFERKVLQEFPDGSRQVLNWEGMIVLETPDALSMPVEVDHLLKDRAAWEKDFKWRLQWSPDRITTALVRQGGEPVPFDKGGLDRLRNDHREYYYGLFCGSLLGEIRNMLGVIGMSYMMADDMELFREIVDAVGDLCYRNVRYVLESGAKFDCGQFWEDIAFKNGPLIRPELYREAFGPHYKRITDLLRLHGIDIVSLDCDGVIDSLVPIWLENGVNTMFPIEVGTWQASIAPWREKYGKGLLGVGGVDKRVFAMDRQAVDTEIERQKPLVALGGYIPCPDHRIPPEAKWDLVRYYCDRMHQTF